MSPSRTSDFSYDLPEQAIAQSAVEPRDAARLLDADALTDHRFADLPALLNPGDLVVVNRTRVRRARLLGHRENGGKVEALLLGPLGDSRWEALVRPARRLRQGDRLTFGGIRAKVAEDPIAGKAVLHLEAPDAEAAIAATGTMPLPPYFKGSLDDDERYQTVFADRLGSAAAPTAGLHFTGELFDALAIGGVQRAFVDLEIGLDTFRPISSETLEGHAMHTEKYRVDEEAAAAVADTRRRGGEIVAIGTTVVRALESAAAQSGQVTPSEGATDLFITPGRPFRAVDRLVTNFHVPGSTLVVLVAAFMGDRWRDAYS
ncbi:MAG: tRNA preQ1(34) S-adenosylmethionine ribosyltransferase-isomerase QueA, partial [Acidimicrobiia bacterium]|nr:tRNA preQ1(34) S-adenosylmethionine ribosyltransferase-isomerase QueA [Acidimicrobiia bacterium]